MILMNVAKMETFCVVVTVRTLMEVMNVDVQLDLEIIVVFA